MFRRICTKQPDVPNLARLIDTVPVEALAEIRRILLDGFVSEQTNDTRHKISDAIAELARPTSSSPEWPELLHALFQGSKSLNQAVRESSFRIFAAVPEIIGSDLIQQVTPVFVSGFADDSEQVRISAVNAFSSFFQVLPRSTWKTLHPLLPNLLNVLSPLRNDSEQLSSVLEPLIELAGLAPKMFRPVFKTVLEFCIEIAKDKDLDINARLYALELATTFADEAPNMCKKEPTYAESMIVQCLSMMTEIGEDDDDASEWNNEDDIVNSEDAEEVYSAAKQSLDRMALKLAGAVILPPLFQWLPRMIGSQQWRERHAALMAISNVAEGCRDVMMAELDKILDIVIPCLDDPHVRVQWAACNALGQMSTDFADYMQKKFGPRVLPALINRLVNTTPRVQAHAAAALVNFSENASKEVLDPYLDALLTNLLELLQSPKRYVQEQVLTTIAIVADAAENKFEKYYDTLMGLLFNVMTTDTGKEYRLLKAKSIECATLIALAVGKEKFAPQCQQMVQIFASIQNGITDADDPCQSYLVHAWGRLCRIIGTDFLPYLGGVMPPLLEAAKHKADLKLFDDEKDVENLEQQEGWEIIPLQGKYVGIRTSLLDEKSNAIELLSVYAAELGADFFSYVQEVVADIIVPSLDFFYHDGVRYSAAQAVPHLLNCAKLAMERNGGDVKGILLRLWTPIFKKMIEVLKVESMVDVQSAFYGSISQSIELIGADASSAEDMAALAQVIILNLDDYVRRVKNREAGDEKDEYTEDVEEDNAEDQDEDLVGEINKAIHSCFKAFRLKFLPAFERLIPVATSFLNSNSVDCRQWALCVFDDLLEYTGPESWRYRDLFLSKLVSDLVDPDASIRQAAAYGVGVAAQYGGQAYAEATVSTLDTLFKITNMAEARSEDNVHATENFSAAIAKVLKKNGQLLQRNLDRAINEWVKTLPIVNDEEAAPYAYLFLSDLIERRHAAVTSQIPKVFDSIAQAITLAAIQGKTLERVIEATKGLLSQLPQGQVLELFTSLPAESQPVIQKCFQ